MSATESGPAGPQGPVTPASENTSFKGFSRFQLAISRTRPTNLRAYRRANAASLRKLRG